MVFSAQSLPIVPIILSGGSGTRLWPLSRSDYPKQFLRLTAGDASLFQQAVLRMAGISGVRLPLVVCNQAHRFVAAEQLQEISLPSQPAILLEPCARNTAPAVAAALYLQETIGDCLMLVMPSDHVIGDVEAFRALILMAQSQARSGRLVAFGITPTHPATGYGYIKRGEALNKQGTYEIAHFAEKPVASLAQEYLDSGQYAWNSGIFLFSCTAYLDELEKRQPQILTACRGAVSGRQSDLDFIRLEQESFSASPALSIDHAVMEHTKKGVVLAMTQPWQDAGDWNALWDGADKDTQGNATVGDVYARDCADCYIRSDGPSISALGVDNLVIVSTKDAVLVTHKDMAQDVGALVQALTHINPSQVASYGRVYRPWGHYDTIDSGGQYQVKRIMIRPGGQLSLQLHRHRAEHWVVVQGTARVQIEDKEWLLEANQAVYVPCGARHRITNPGPAGLHIVEVQTGDYLGEDDIVRLADQYGRIEEV